MTRDIRSLGEYIEHFKVFSKTVDYDDKYLLETIGMIHRDQGKNIFVPVLYGGKYIYSNTQFPFVKSN